MFAVGGHRLTDRLRGALAGRPSDDTADRAVEPVPRRHVPALAAFDRAGTSPVTARYWGASPASPDAPLALSAQEIA
jgi:hypothetical protein